MLFLITNIFFLFAVLCLLTFVISLALVMTKGAPWLPTPPSKVREMLRLATAGPDDVVIDLGAGDGVILFTAVREFGVAKAIGYELNPFFVLSIRLRSLLPRYRGRVQVRRKNLFDTDLSEASIITCFLLQTTNEKLESKLARECKPGTRIVSRAFSFPNLTLKKKYRGGQTSGSTQNKIRQSTKGECRKQGTNYCAGVCPSCLRRSLAAYSRIR